MPRIRIELTDTVRAVVLAACEPFAGESLLCDPVTGFIADLEAQQIEGAIATALRIWGGSSDLVVTVDRTHNYMLTREVRLVASVDVPQDMVDFLHSGCPHRPPCRGGPCLVVTTSSDLLRLVLSFPAPLPGTLGDSASAYARAELARRGEL